MYLIDSITITDREHFKKLLMDLHLDTTIQNIESEDNFVTFVKCNISNMKLTNDFFKQSNVKAIRFEKCRLNNVTIDNVSTLVGGLEFNRSFLHHLTINKLSMPQEDILTGELSFRKCEIDELAIFNSKVQELRFTNSSFYISDLPNIIKDTKFNSLVFAFSTILALNMVNCTIKTKKVFLYDSLIHSSFRIIKGNLKDITKYHINDSMFKYNPFDEPMYSIGVTRPINTMIYYFPKSNWVIDGSFHGELDLFCKRVDTIYNNTDLYDQFQEVISYFKRVKDLHGRKKE